MTKRVILFKLLGRGNVFAMGRRASLRCLKYYTYEGVLLIHPLFLYYSIFTIASIIFFEDILA
jgi:hypothetical protein